MQPNRPIEVSLVNIEVSQDSIGQIIETKTTTQVMATVFSVSSSYKLEAAEKGISLSFRILVRGFEYDNQDKVVIDDKEYQVFSTYYRDDGYVELTLQEATGLDG